MRERVNDDVDREIKKMIRAKEIGKEDSEAVRTILTWLRCGRAEARKISTKYVKNLMDNGFANKDGYLICNEDDDQSIWFLMAVAGAQGYIEQHNEGDLNV